MKLSDGERMSALWRKLEQHLTDRLATLRARNDGNLPPDETAKVRGQIAEVKSFLEIGTPKLVIDD